MRLKEKKKFEEKNQNNVKEGEKVKRDKSRGKEDVGRVKEDHQTLK